MIKDNITLELWHSKCEKDYKSKHFWEKLGVIEESGEYYLIWKCSQCQKCLKETLIFLDIGDESFRIPEEREKERKVVNYFMKKIKVPENLSRKSFYTILSQVYYLAQEDLKSGGTNRKK
jgi:hypothetical protein